MTVSNSIVSILFAAILSVLPGCAEFPRTSEAAGFLFGTAAASGGLYNAPGFFYTPDAHAVDISGRAVLLSHLTYSTASLPA